MQLKRLTLEEIQAAFFLRMYKFLKPIIFACNGPAVGIGASMQLPGDIRIASEDARFGFVFNNRGIVPDACSSWFLPKSSVFPKL